MQPAYRLSRTSTELPARLATSAGAASCYTWLGDNERGEEHANEIISQHTLPDGTSDAPMRLADARIDLGVVAARRGDLDQAVVQGNAALDFERQSLTDLVAHASDLDQVLQNQHPGEQLAQDFHERLITAKQSLRNPDH